MLKWILGGLLVIVVVLGGTCWYGYNKITEGGSTAETAIAGSQEHVFAALIDPDSMIAWMEPGATVSPRGRPLVPGDTLRVRGKVGNANQDMRWIVRSVTAPNLLVLELRTDSTNSMVMIRRDSLFRRNDSTIIMSAFDSPMIDSAGAAAADSSKMVGGMMNSAMKMVVGGFRMLTIEELKQLKAHIEGTPR